MSGPPRCVLELAEVLQPKGHEFVVAYRIADTFLPRWDAIGSRLVQVPNFGVSLSRPIRSSLGTMRSARGAAATAPDVVYCNFHLTLPFSVAVARRLDVPLVVNVCQPLPEGSRAFFRFFRWLIGRASATTFISEQLRASYERAGLTGSDAAVVPVGVDTGVYRQATVDERDRAREALDIETSQPVVLYMGRLDPTKGIETLIEAVGRMHDSVNVLVAGSPTARVDQRGTDTYASRLVASAPGGVRFIGRHDDNRALLWAADVVVVPSVWPEPLGRVPLEAMACGVPVVASRIGGLPEIFTGELAEMLFRPGDAEELASAVTRMLPGRSQRPSGELLRAHVAEHFNLDTVATSLESILLSAAGA
ncbi:MAG TPA: glycosyltransferase family 4 protein [Acidimicrobiales bacterium]|nr:glycosyltransferase family 4 protein [Acidimicrobiales bacterium]